MANRAKDEINLEESEKPESRHAATDPQKCRDMEKKYRWQLLRVERTGDSVLKVDCIFAGETEFPKHHSED